MSFDGIFEDLRRCLTELLRGFDGVNEELFMILLSFLTNFQSVELLRGFGGTFEEMFHFVEGLRTYLVCRRPV